LSERGGGRRQDAWRLILDPTESPPFFGTSAFAAGAAAIGAPAFLRGQNLNSKFEHEHHRLRRAAGSR
jgi:hypothetical protein